MTEQWMQDNTVSDVQTAIQSQIIQTALEKNTSDLTPQALQSFLTQAPIPRARYESSTNTTTSQDGVEIQCAYLYSDRVIDTHTFLQNDTINWLIPVDGFYNITASLRMGAANGDRLSETYLALFAVTKRPLATQYLMYDRRIIQGSGLGVVLEYTTQMHGCIPFNAGDTFQIKYLQRLGGPRAVCPNTFSIVWAAPFTNYQGGQN